MSEPFRFSHRPNRAHEIEWRAWDPAAFEEAAASDKPILLNLTAFWCRSCQEMDEVTYSDDEIIELLNDGEVVPIRVDADRMPPVQERYIAGGWPTTAVLAPSGEVFWSGTYVKPYDLKRAIGGVLEAWADRREELKEEIAARARAMQAARSRRPAAGMVRREAADDVLTGAQEQFDPRNGGFGDAPKFLHAEAIELLFSQAESLPNPDWAAMASRTLDGMLAGEIIDPVHGGFFHYAHEADWTRPQVEKLLEVNARALEAYSVGVEYRGRTDWAEAAEGIVAWADATLRREDGLWRGSQAADPEYYEGSGAGDPPPVDPTVYTHSCAMWIASLARAGARMDRPDWLETAGRALDTLLETMSAPDDSLVHYDDPDEGDPPAGLLADLLHAARACEAVSAAGGPGADEALDHARRLVRTMERTLWAEDGGFVDHPAGPDPLGALRYADRPFEENAQAARLLIALAARTGDGGYRAMAERVLALLSPLAGRYAVEGATFASAVEEFFELRRR